MIKDFKIFEDDLYKEKITSSQLIDFIMENDLRNCDGDKIDYNEAKDIAYHSDSGIWTLQKLTDLNKDGLDYIFNRKPKTFGKPIIVVHKMGNDTYEILDGKHRIGYTRYKGILNIMAYVCENED
jgi:hypothetical protein